MTIWTIALFTGIAGLVWTFLERYLKKTDDFTASFIKNWVASFFIFSAVVKLVDPVGFSIKLNDYFDVFHVSFFKPFSLFLSFAILILEFVIGILLLFNIFKRTCYALLMGTIIFFTFLTGVSAIFNVVQDCGCFGDFLKISPWTSFIKDIVLLIMSSYIVRQQKHFSSFFQNSQWAYITAGLAIFVSFAFEAHNYFHLPIWDFRPYKVGTYIPDAMVEIQPPVYENQLIYKNKNTGEEKTFIDEFPDGDEWEFVDRKQIVLEKGIPAPIHDFILTSNEGEDLTSQILDFEKPILLFVINDLDKVKNHGVEALKSFINQSDQTNEINYAFLSSSSDEQLELWKSEQGLIGTNLAGDETMLKTMIRSNPGVVLLRKGTIMGKWNFRDFPTYEKLEARLKFN